MMMTESVRAIIDLSLKSFRNAKDLKTELWRMKLRVRMIRLRKRQRRVLLRK